MEKEKVHSFIPANPLVRSVCDHVHAGNFKLLLSAIDDIGDIEITFTVLTNGAPHVWMSFLVRMFVDWYLIFIN